MIVLKFAAVLTCLHVVAGDFEYSKRVPDYVQECFSRAQNHSYAVEHDLGKDACVRAYFNQIMKPNALTDEDKAFFELRATNGFGRNKPATGHRTRRDIRLLSEEERQKVWDAFEALYKDGTFHRFGRLHGVEMFRKHRGAAFLPWHRVFLVDLEEELRKKDPSVSLPYWDYTMDYYIPRPSDSVVWSDCFFGNGHNTIDTGPFAGWYGGFNIEIRRDYASGGEYPPRLINKRDIDEILQYCDFKDITTGGGDYFNNTHNLELHHDGVHDWVGGDMDAVPYSAYDPVFWMHHAFIDYIWEIFREHQKDGCNGVDIETDYRPMDDLAQNKSNSLLNEPTHPMLGYTHLMNQDGLWLNWTTEFYSYEPQPQCPDCGNSQFLYCNKSIDSMYPDGVCVSKTAEMCTSRHRRAAAGIKLTRPPPVCDSQLSFDGLEGDGRSRNMDVADAHTILISQLGINQKRLHTMIPAPSTNSGSSASIGGCMMFTALIILVLHM